MNWRNLLDFMTRRDPSFGPSLVGISQAEIDTCQRELGIEFPSTYVDFLRTMGAETGRHYPFGRTFDSNFYRILHQIPPEDYDVHDYFLIAWDTNETSCPPFDLYLDMRRSDGKDAELLMAENGSGWAPHDGLRLTLLEYLTWNAWRGFEAFRRKSNRILSIRPPKPSNLDRALGRARDLLSGKGFVPALPPLRRIECFESTSVGAIVRVHEYLSLTQVVIAGDDERELAKLVELFLDNVAGASVGRDFRSIEVY